MADPGIEDALDIIATLIAEKVVEMLGGQPPAQVQPADTEDAPTTPPAEDEPAADDEATAAAAEEDDDEEPEETTDLVPDAYKEFVAEEVADKDLDGRKTDLLEFYVDILGNTKKAINASLKSMSDEEIEAAYTDYCARLVMVGEDGELAYAPDFETPYQATRINDGDESLAWCIGGRTLTDEEVAEKKLGEAPAEEKKKGPPKGKKRKK